MIVVIPLQYVDPNVFCVAYSMLSITTIALAAIGGSRRHCQGGQGGARSFSAQQCLFYYELRGNSRTQVIFICITLFSI